MKPAPVRRLDTYVINLDRSVDRWRAFAALGEEGRVIRFPAVDGETLVRDALVARGLIASDLAYTTGALGNAFSHLALWDKAIALGRPLTIVEDDAVFNGNFWTESERLAASLGTDWDIVYWGWNFDSILTFDLMPGVSPCVATFSEEDLRQGLATFRAADLRPHLYRLFGALGIVCYSVSPRGAQALKSFVLPLSNGEVKVPGLAEPVPNRDLSILMNGLFPRIAAFVSVPPLAVTPNDRTRSTVLPSRDLP